MHYLCLRFYLSQSKVFSSTALSTGLYVLADKPIDIKAQTKYFDMNPDLFCWSKQVVQFLFAKLLLNIN